MAELTAARRDKLKDSDFALPGRKYPIQDESHARNALARVAQHGTPAEQKRVRAVVHARYPDIGAADAKAESDFFNGMIRRKAQR